MSRRGRVADAVLEPLNGNRQRPIPLQLPISIIGSRQTAEVYLNSRRVQASHAAIVYDGWRFWLRDLNTADCTFCNNLPVEEAQIGNTTELEFAGQRLVLKVNDPHMVRDAARVQLADVKLTYGGTGQPLLLDRVVTTIGSQRGCDVLVAHRQITRVHALLIRTCTALWLCDMCTQTGTRVNGRKRDQVMLKAGDILEIGPLTLAVSQILPGARTESAAVNQLNATARTVPMDHSDTQWEIQRVDEDVSYSSMSIPSMPTLESP